jgi:hypothetical protein
LYEAKTKLVISAIVPREDLFVGFDSAVDTHKGNEEIAINDINLGRERELFLGDSSSSSSTALIRADMLKSSLPWLLPITSAISQRATAKLLMAERV